MYANDFRRNFLLVETVQLKVKETVSVPTYDFYKINMQLNVVYSTLFREHNLNLPKKNMFKNKQS